MKEDVIVLVEEKFERRLVEEISKLRGELREEMAGLRVELANTRADLIRWMFIFWVGQVATILGILFAFFR
ncbi:MAG: hypothetical protein ACE5NP_00505 [Anaerolineae bacterium]